jgi:polar amino acid transport system substrate-binding protein
MQINSKTIGTMIGLILGCALILSGCAPTPSAVVDPDPGIVRVGVSPDAPPLIYKENDRITGLEADLATALGAHLGRRTVLVELPWEDQIPALLDNRTDIIMSGMSVTLARQYQIAFSKPYFKSGLMILTKNLQKYTFITNIETILAQSVTWRMGVVEGTTGESFLQQKSIGAKSIKAFSNQEKALDALVAGHIDVFIHDAPIILMMAAQNQLAGVKPIPVMLNEEFLAWGLRKEDTDLIAAVNAFIDRSKQDGSLQTTVKRWIPLAR